jgi:hypothetical protein
MCDAGGTTGRTVKIHWKVYDIEAPFLLSTDVNIFGDRAVQFWRGRDRSGEGPLMPQECERSSPSGSVGLRSPSLESVHGSRYDKRVERRETEGYNVWLQLPTTHVDVSTS